jgi:prepilin-type N-terminal cleavage/methylation domain-containing protein
MLKNNKGMSLIEMIAVVLIIAILSAIALPMYRSTVEKTKILSNLPLVKAFQDAIIQYYPENNEYPVVSTTNSTPNLKKLYVTVPGDWSYQSDGSIKKNDSSCTLALLDDSGNRYIGMSCKNGGAEDYSLRFYFILNASGVLAPGNKLFVINATSQGRLKILQKVAQSSQWAQLSSPANSYRIP